MATGDPCRRGTRDLTTTPERECYNPPRPGPAAGQPLSPKGCTTCP